MRNEKLTGIFISPRENIFEVRTITDNLRCFYNLLDCDLIDITTRRVCGRSFDFICDDEGLFKTPCLPSACDQKGVVALVGSLFICNCDSDGELKDLTEDDINVLLSRKRSYYLDGDIYACIALDDDF